MTRNGVPSSSPVSYTATTLGWLKRAADRASCSNRSRSSARRPRPDRSTLIATGLPSRSSTPSYTSAMPPRPNSSPSRYRPPRTRSVCLVSVATRPSYPTGHGRMPAVEDASPAVAGLLLTGGRSRRFGSDKARLPVEGVPNAQRLANVLAAALDGPVFEVGPGHTTLPTAPEDQPGEGPLAAIAAGARALRAAGHDGPAVVLACDLPFADEDLVRFLAGQPGTTVPVVDGRPQPLCARYDGPALAAAPRLVADGARAVNALLDIVPLRLLDGMNPLGLLDVDTPEDLARAEAVRRPTTPVPVRTVGRTTGARPDTLVTEEPLEVRVGGPDDDLVTANVTMRTPGHDFDLAVGWLLAEGVVRDADDVATVRYCALGADEPQRYNVVSVRLTRTPDLDGIARRTTTTASCGVCGTASLDRLAEQLPGPVPAGEPVALDTLLALPDALRAA